MMDRRTFGTLALVSVISCTPSGPPPEPTPARQSSLSIIGTLIDGTTRTTGELDIDLLEHDLLSACLAEVSEASFDLCPNDSRQFLDLGDCPSHQCIQHLELCVGHKLMEVADEVSLFQLTVDRLVREPDGRVRFTVDRRLSYEIPPQSAENRTLAYQLASRAFGLAGERGVDAISLDSCMTEIMGTADEPDVELNRAEIFAVDYGDTVQAFSEATDKLVRNEVHVAGDKSQTVRDFSDARHLVWNDNENSIRAAAAALAMADGDVEGDNLRLPICLRPADADSVQLAVDFLRAEPVVPILDQVMPDIDVVAAAQDAFVQDFPELYPGGEDPMAFLSRFNLSLADVAGARRYLKDEHVVFDRTMLETDPGSGKIAGLASPPAPLPAAAALAKTAGARVLPTTDVTDPAYRASGALQRLDYLRWGARKALRQSETAPSLLTPRLRPLFSAAAAIGEVDSGHIRLEITAAASIPIDLDEIPIPPSTLAVRLHGVEESDQFLLVGSTDGLRCVLGGSIEGAPCDPDEYVLSGDATFEPGDNYGQELDGTQTFVIAAVTQPVFVLSHNSPPEVIGGFDGAAAVAAEGGLLLPIGGSLADDLRDLVAPSPFQCGRTANACPGLPADLVVPLESEITEDNDPYENSWKHYLDLADGMAREADALGEDLVRAGLELDQRGEAARDGLEAVCGGVVNVADVFDSAENGGGTPEELISDAAQLHDPSLLGCLPAADKSDLEPWVTLGSEDLCAWRYKALPPCVCPPAIGSCGGRCPVPRGEGDCALPPEIVGDPDFELIPGGGVVRALGLLPPPRESPSDVSCAELGVLRDPDGPRDANARADLARVLQKQDWMRPRVLRQLVSAATYDEDWRDGLALSVYGAGVFSTAGSNNLPPCSEPVGGDATRATAPALFPLSDDDVCAFTAGRAERRRWIADMRRAFGTLGLISGALDGNMTRSWAVANSGDCSDKLEDPGQQICGWAPGPQSCGQLEQGCRSLSDADLDDPDGVNTAYGNVVWPAARFDHTVELELADGASTALNRLWGLSVPSAGESSIPTTLTSPHEHASFSFNWAGIFFRPEQEDRGIFYMPPRDSFLDPADDAIAADFASLTHEDVLDALALGCYLAATQGGGCETFNPTDVPVIRDARDLRHLEQHLLCAADGILTSAGRSLLASVPVVVASSVGSGQPLSLYPGYRGELLNALVALQTDLEQAALTSNAIQGQVRQAAYATSLARQQLEISDIHGQLAQLQTLAQMLATVTNALTTAVQSLGVGSVAAAGAAGQLVLLDQMGTLEAQLTELEQGTILTQYAQQTGDIMAELTRLGSDLRETVFRLNSDLARIESLRNSAMSLAARAAFMDRDEAGRLFPVTSVMRRRYNTARIRYERARDRARQMAFIARRAIEQRFGVDLEQMNDDLTLVDAPSGWANEVCTFEGIDYARIRQAQVDEQVPEEERVPENFADGYLGEYVQKLRLFVETYPFDFPFQDGSDLAVVSLRDDIFRARRECEVEVPNLVASSEQLSGTDGEDPAAAPWRVEGCAEGDAGLLPCLHLATQQGLVLADRMANRTADNDISMPEATGRLVQEIEITRTPVDLLASWTDRFFAPADAAALGAEDLGVDAPIPYRVTLERVGGAPEERVDETFALLDDDQPHANQLGVLTVLAPGTIRLTIDPSADDLVRGDVWLAELQVEVLEPGEDPIPSAYMPTVRSGFSIQAVCPDLEGEALRDRYFADREERVCPSGLGRDCDEDGGNVLRTESFHEALFGLGLEQIERGEIIPSAQIALGNYNYRHDLIAVNLVGTNVRDCSRSDEPATCYSNAFVPFTLVHEGDDIPVRNHDGETVPFDFERAFIEHGKALSSEVVLTNPLTGSAETLLGSYYKQEFRGRPLAGHYTLRIWDDPALNWQNVEDVQLVFRYRYWTRFER